MFLAKFFPKLFFSGDGGKWQQKNIGWFKIILKNGLSVLL